MGKKKTLWEIIKDFLKNLMGKKED